jgi:hypothetical protein
MHSEWYLDSKDGEGAMRVKMGYRSGKGSRVKHEKITPAMMKEVAEELYSCRRELAKFINDHRPK